MSNRNSSRTISPFRREKFKISKPVTSVLHDHLTFSMSYLICLTFIHIFQVQYLSRRHVMPFISSALFKNKIFHFIYLASSTQNAWSRSNRDKLSFFKIIEDRFPISCGRCWATVFFAVDLRKLPTTHFFGKFFTWAGISGWSFRNRGQLHAVALYSAGKKINKLRTIGESYPLSLFCKHPRKLSIDQAGNIEGTLCQSFKTSYGTITRITWSKTREIIKRFSGLFWTFRNFLKIEG